MLLEYSVENFRSIRERAVLSLFPSSGIKESAKSVISLETKKQNIKVLTEAVIFGPNGSGKSALLESFEAMQSILNDSVNKKQKSSIQPIEPFAFDDISQILPTSFWITGVVDSIKFEYSFSATRNEILEESLYLYYSSRPSKVFKRTRQNYTTTGKWKKYINQYRSMVKPNSLFLGVAGKLSADGSGEILADILSWLTESITFSAPASLRKKGEDLLKNDFLAKEGRKNRMLELMKSADFAISDFEVKFNEPDLSDFPNFEGESIEQVTRLFKDWVTDIESSTTHVVDGKNYLLPLAKESEGTQNYFYLLPLIIQTLDQGGVLILDEIESSLHPFLVREITDLFRNKEINSKNAQLIFSTHDVLLMEIKHFRRDEIWFMEKSRKNQDSELFSLADFSVRRDENYLKNYLLGRYGAVPNLLTSYLEKDYDG